MSRLFSYLRRALCGIAVVGSLGFGATQAFGNPEPSRSASCPAKGYPYSSLTCKGLLGCSVGGYCTAAGQCKCGYIP